MATSWGGLKVGKLVNRDTNLSKALATNEQTGKRSFFQPGLMDTRNTANPMSAQEVQNVVNQNANGTAAQAAALQLEPGLNVNGLGTNGNGNWYNLLGAGGRVSPLNAQQFQAANPGAYNSPYAPAMREVMNGLLNPEQFRYDVNADGLYQQIKDNYVKSGRQAMMNTQGQSAALTGGYGNSYGAMAGQQAYQESLGGLAGMIPELQQLAYQQYMNGEDAKRNNLEALNKMNEQEYSHWMDEMAAYTEALKTLIPGMEGMNLGANYTVSPGVTYIKALTPKGEEMLGLTGNNTGGKPTAPENTTHNNIMKYYHNNNE